MRHWIVERRAPAPPSPRLLQPPPQQGRSHGDTKGPPTPPLLPALQRHGSLRLEHFSDPSGTHRAETWASGGGFATRRAVELSPSSPSPRSTTPESTDTESSDWEPVIGAEPAASPSQVAHNDQHQTRENLLRLATASTPRGFVIEELSGFRESGGDGQSNFIRPVAIEDTESDRSRSRSRPPDRSDITPLRSFDTAHNSTS